MTLEWSAEALADLDRFAALLHDRHLRRPRIVAAEIEAKARVVCQHLLIERDGWRL